MKMLKSRGAQWPLVVAIAFTFRNWVIDSVDQVSKTFGSTVANSTDPAQAGLTGPVANTIVFDMVALPPGAVITGGELIVETAWAGSTAATASIGSAGSPTALGNAIDLKATGRTALTLTALNALLFNDGGDVRVTLAYTVANATAGKARLDVQYIVDGRTNETQTA